MAYYQALIACYRSGQILEAAMRPRDPEERRERVRIAPYNAGALFVLAGATVWQADLALPAAAAVNKGWRAQVTGATVTTFATVVAGGGANFVPVISTGAAWMIG